MTEGTKKSAPSASEVFQGAAETFRAGMKTMANVQEEAGKWWTDLVADVGSPAEWQKRSETAVKEAISAAERNIEDGIAVANGNAVAGMELMRKMLAMAQSPSFSDAQARLGDLWESSLTTVRQNMQIAIQANARAMEACANFARRGSEVVGAAADLDADRRKAAAK